jgi:hypothetical protein
MESLYTLQAASLLCEGIRDGLQAGIQLERLWPILNIAHDVAETAVDTAHTEAAIRTARLCHIQAAIGLEEWSEIKSFLEFGNSSRPDRAQIVHETFLLWLEACSVVDVERFAVERDALLKEFGYSPRPLKIKRRQEPHRYVFYMTRKLHPASLHITLSGGYGNTGDFILEWLEGTLADMDFAGNINLQILSEFSRAFIHAERKGSYVHSAFDTVPSGPAGYRILSECLKHVFAVAPLWRLANDKKAQQIEHTLSAL